ncbi:hypothetical protein AB0B45_15365 [Nonomuraea sp. NPDC049152]|uniref:hypothetical protein n=1 Tax=Nonomuraea sp. NPDC049152 TaxID=3154350 RepID=UPI0033D50625
MKGDRTRWALGCLAVAAAARHAVGLRQMRATLSWLAQPPPTTTTAAAVPVHIVVPVLREQQHVPSAMDWFAALLHELPGSTLTVVTTAREERERQHLAGLIAERGNRPITGRRFPQLTAAEIDALTAEQAASGRLTRHTAARVLARFPLTSDVLACELERHRGLPIRHVHYSGGGRKAGQVNYAVARLGADAGSYVAVYDVDSRPTPAVMAATLAFIQLGQAADGELPEVLQQPAWHARRAARGRAWERTLCQGAADLQTLWTLRREIPYARRYGKLIGRGRQLWWGVARAGVSQPVGHGLFVRGDVFDRVGGLPEFTLLDDVPFGYQLTMHRVPVVPVPVMTVADAPEQAGEALAQGHRWFRSYLDYPAVARHASAAGAGTAGAHAAALAVCLYRGVAWLSASPCTAACLLVAVSRRHRWPVRVAAVAALAWGVVAPVVLLGHAEGHTTTARGVARRAVGLLAAYLLRSVGPWQAVAHAATCSQASPLSPKANRAAGAAAERTPT